MPPKKGTGAAATKKAAATPAHASYRDMVKEAILTLKERKGSSRVAIKKYVQANHKAAAASASFDTQMNKAIRTGVEKGELEQPKGASGTVKLAQPQAAAKPAAAKKDKVTKTQAPATKKKVGAPKKATKAAAPKTAAPKKVGAPKKAAVPKAKANTASKRKAPVKAPAIVDEAKVLGKTKSGRVTKGPANTATSNPVKGKKAAPKKAAAKKTATPKKATPKKADAATS